MADDTEEPQQRYKVGRVVSMYDLADLHATLSARWRGDDGYDARSLRDLADEINVTVLESVMNKAGMDPLAGEVENAYRLLTDDDVSAGVRTQQRNRLGREGLDVDSLLDDFVTHQAVHTYLTKALDVSKADDTTNDPLETAEQRISRLRGRTEAVAEGSVESLLDAGELTLGEHDVFVDVNVYCRDCNTQYDASTLLASGGCECA